MLPPDSSFTPGDHVFQSPDFHEIVDAAVDFLRCTPTQPLPPPSSFAGPGVYLIYYTGPYEPYAPIAESNRQKYEKPIYAGKASPSGRRQARSTSSSSTALYGRLREHERSIRATDTLSRQDFTCRLMILDGKDRGMIATVEAALIDRYKPLWNSCIDGFGNHDPGKNRYHQRLAEWDALHPGRTWEKKCTGSRPDYNDLLQKIGDYLG